ncbi:hypothetical protein ABK046_03895 [Streptomyces caeruleatus]
MRVPVVGEVAHLDLRTGGERLLRAGAQPAGAGTGVDVEGGALAARREPLRGVRAAGGRPVRPAAGPVCPARRGTPEPVRAAAAGQQVLHGRAAAPTSPRAQVHPSHPVSLHPRGRAASLPEAEVSRRVARSA